MRRVLGRYELLRQLARGGMAEVFLARRRAAAGVEKRLVLKLIRRDLAADPRFVQLFVKEARLSIDLAHANIVPVFDFGRAGDELFLAMEYIPGADLAAALKRARAKGQTVDPVLVAHIGAEACQGLDYAHRRRDADGRPLGIVHRDVSPRNVLLSFAGEVKLVDFGVASLHADDVAVSARVRGTPAYMSPEQAQGLPVDGRADLFSLGLVLAEALSGERAHADADVPTTLAAARSGHAPPLPDTIPAALRAAILRATHADRDARFADAGAMQQALDNFVVGARAADPGRPALSQQLANWLRDLFPEDEPVITPSSDGALSATQAAPALSFLDDGEDVVARTLAGEQLGPSTLRSVAETLGDADPPKRRRWPWLAGVGGVALAAGITVIATNSSKGTQSIAVPASATAPVPTPALVPAPASAPVPTPTLVHASAPAPVPGPASAPTPTVPVAAHHPITRPSAPPAPTPAKLYPVLISAKPWARVFIDGKLAADETPFSAQLSAGTHTVRFDNPQTHATRTIQLAVPHEGPVVEDLSQ